ncbi:MAG TPA: response regulator transcription factor [Candidatus Limnocylindrales bacterium]|nr:response regulator transcription factor [Candidatus Limnocylindrales bacterium]
MHLLVVEDDARLSRLLKRLLSQDRHVVETALTAEEGLEVATSDLELDAIVLDVGLPDRSGFDVARTLRKKGSQVPILMLTARDSVSDRVEGLDAGADDYLVKPFAYEELLARLRALGRRPPTRKSPVLKAGPIELDETTRRVAVSGKSVDLSQREFSILECLLRRPGQVLSRDQLLDYAWPYGVALTPNTVEAYIHLLREKLGADGALHVETVRGVGYRLREG